MDSKKSLHGLFNIYPGAPERLAEIAENYLIYTASPEKAIRERQVMYTGSLSQDSIFRALYPRQR